MTNSNDLLVFSHLRWNFIFQRPQHLMTRFAKHRRVFFIEEPMFEDVSFPKIHTHQSEEGVFVITPYLPQAFMTRNQDNDMILTILIDELILARNIRNFTAWYYSPGYLRFTRHLGPKYIIYDIIENVLLSKNNPLVLRDLEDELFEKANLAFTGGQSLYKAKRFRHPNIHAFPSSIDKVHFGQARLKNVDASDQAEIAHPRIGFYGVLNERIDFDLLAEIAALRPDYQFILIGPVVNVDPALLPQAVNIHYLGQKSYRELPQYIAGWDAAMMPFALTDRTRFVSPTNTPEFLAAGLPVVATALEDIMSPYGEEQLVRIAHTASEFASGIENAMKDRRNLKWQVKVDSFLAEISWDQTWQKMAALESEIATMPSRAPTRIHPSPDYRPLYTTSTTIT